MTDPRELFPRMKIYPNSVVETPSNTYFMISDSESKKLGVLGEAPSFTGEHQNELMICLLTGSNATALRDVLPWLRPQCIGLQKSVGCGDRLGLATPGHVRAFRKVEGIAPVFAQQSMRENARTGRSPGDVIDDAMWGLFQEGWRSRWGADADHLKTQLDVQHCLSAGYRLFTVDCGDHVDNAAPTDSYSVLQKKLELLPWEDLEDSLKDLSSRYLIRQLRVDDFPLKFSEMELWAAACKYARVVRHAVTLYRYILGKIDQEAFEFEISIDETDTPTTIPEHFFIASELNRLGVKWISLAPRYVGRFEKGVDYIGDLDTFADLFSKHIAIPRTLGPYKSESTFGSDKYRIYPIVANHAGELMHLKTSGTSYLEALRVILNKNRMLFRDILTFAYERYSEDNSSYVISTDPSKVPLLKNLPKKDLDDVLDTFYGRQILHVTYGSVLEKFGSQLKSILEEDEEAYYKVLEEHFNRHLAPFNY